MSTSLRFPSTAPQTELDKHRARAKALGKALALRRGPGGAPATVLLVYAYTCADASSGPQQLELRLMPGLAAWAVSSRSCLGQRVQLVANLPGKGLAVLGEYDTYPNEYRAEHGLENGRLELVRKARRYGLRIQAGALAG